MKTLFVIAGRAPSWVIDQTRYAAQQLTADGRVRVAVTSRPGGDVRLPGEMGESTLLGIASTGFPLWTGRTMSVLGVRRRYDRNVIVLFDQTRPMMNLIAAIVARIRSEYVVIHDLSTAQAKPSWWRRTMNDVVKRLADSRFESHQPVETFDRALALAVCDGDREFAAQLVDTVQAMAAETAAGWQVIVQSTDPEIERLVANSSRSEMMTCESGPVPSDLLLVCDVVIVRNGLDDSHAKQALASGAAAVIVDHPVGARISRRFDGAWLARPDVSSILVAMESARGSIYGSGRSAPDARSDGDGLVRLVRERTPVPV